MAEAKSIFKQYPVAKWEAKGKAAIPFSVVSIQETYGNRLIRHKRLHRDGARLDDTGSSERVFEITTEWYNGNEEPGIKRDEQYPDELNKLCEACRVHETGTLTIPTHGPLRCRLETYRRMEQSGERDAAGVTFVFVEDNEDDSRASNFQAPSAKSAARPAGAKASKALTKAGLEDSVGALASKLEDLANAPGNFVGGMERTAQKLVNNVEQTERAFRDARASGKEKVVGILSSPEDSFAAKTMRRLADIAHRATAEVAGVGAKIVTKKYDRQVSIFDVATEVQQPAERLMQLNTGLPDPFAIPAKTPIRVFDTTVA